MSLRIERVVKWACWMAGVGAFVAVLATTDLRRAIPIVIGVGPLVVLGLIPYVGQIALDALAWRTLLGALDHRIRWRRLVAVRLSTEAVLMTMPGGTLVGESLKPYLLARTAAVPMADTVASVGIKRCLLAYAQAIYLAIALALGYDVLAHSRIVVHLPLLVVGAIALLLAVATGLVLAFVNAKLVQRVRGALARLPSKRLRAALDARRAGFAAADAGFARVVAHRGRIAVALAILVAAWLVEAVETYLICRLVGIDLPVTAVLAMEATVVFARNAAFFVPAGLGVQDAGYLAFFAAFGVAAPAAAAFVIVKRVKELVWIALGYLTLATLDRSSASVRDAARPGKAGAFDAEGVCP